MPNIFFTFSYVDFQNPTLHKMINNQSNKAKCLNMNSYIAILFFKKTIKLVMDEFFKKLPGYKWNFYRLEF